MSRCASLLLLVGVTVFVAVAPVWCADTCFLTDAPPNVPFGLQLCYMHSHAACCLPGFDQDIQNAYTALVPNGQGCVPGSQRVYASLYALREYLCLPCDPQEPSYRFESVKGDIVDGGVVPPSKNSVAGEQTWRICRSFLYGKEGSLEGLWGNDGSRYGECGVIVSSCMSTPVFNITSATFQTPSLTCTATNELIIPSVAYRDSPDPALEMLSMVAQSMPDFQFVIVDDDPNYDYEKTPCFGRDSAAGLPLARWSRWLPVFALSLSLLL